MTVNYVLRRQRLAESLPAESIAIIPGASEFLRNGDSHYRFRQDSDFYYLTGFDEPDAVLLILKEKESISTLLFNRPKVIEHEQWTGPRLGQADAPVVLNIDQAYAIETFETQLPQFLAGKSAIYYPVGKYPQYESCVLKAWNAINTQVRRGTQSPGYFADLKLILGEMRLIKSPEEIVSIREAARVSILGHLAAMKACRHAKFEYELEAAFLYAIVKEGCRNTAYDSIIAGGERACILHYTDNNKPLDGTTLVLIDAAAEFDHYAADITRTFPIRGSFNPHQRQIYELVLRAQQAGIACVSPGKAWTLIQEIIVRVLVEGLVDLGILKGAVDRLIKEEAYKPFYMHSSGHWLGLDVHDAGVYKIKGKTRSLEAGMVLTVEPGLYIPKNMTAVDPVWRGIGVRIEDDILVTSEGCENLTEALPVAVDVLEEMICG